MIHEFPKKRVKVRMTQWTGTPESVEEIRAFTRDDRYSGHGFYPKAFYSDEGPDAVGAQLWVAHQQSWEPLPLGHWVAQELDGNGFYPISPEGLVGGYDLPPAGLRPLPVVLATDPGVQVEQATACPPTCACGGRGIDPETEHPTQYKEV